MRSQIYVIVSCCFVLCCKLEFSNAKAIIGQNVRPVKDSGLSFIVSFLKVNGQAPDSLINRFCTGTLVSLKDVLTAHHCLSGKDLNSIRIILGSIDLRLGSVYFPLWWISYDTWINSKNRKLEFKENDVAVTRLTKSVSENIKPAVISTMSNNNLYKKEVSIAGWGKSNTGQIPMIMETASLKVLSIKECEDRAKRIDGLTSSFPTRLLCTAAYPYVQLNVGDSGGPLLYHNTVVGINYGTCLRPDLPFHPEKMNIHFGTDYYREFILDIINNYK